MARSAHSKAERRVSSESYSTPLSEKYRQPFSVQAIIRETIDHCLHPGLSPHKEEDFRRRFEAVKKAHARGSTLGSDQPAPGAPVFSTESAQYRVLSTVKDILDEERKRPRTYPLPEEVDSMQAESFASYRTLLAEELRTAKKPHLEVLSSATETPAETTSRPAVQEARRQVRRKAA